MVYRIEEEKTNCRITFYNQMKKCFNFKISKNPAFPVFDSSNCALFQLFQPNF